MALFINVSQVHHHKESITYPVFVFGLCQGKPYTVVELIRSADELVTASMMMFNHGIDEVVVTSVGGTSPILEVREAANSGSINFMFERLAPPYTIVEVEPGPGSIRAWRPIYNFDTADNGRMESLPDFLFELKTESSGSKTKYPRPYRLYVDGQPCLGGQWQYDIDGALHTVEHVVGSYAHQRRTKIYADQQAEHCAAIRKLNEK